MAERDEGRGLLGSHDASQLRHGQGVALSQLVIPKQPEGGGAQDDGSAGCGCSTRGDLPPDVHHDGPALGVCMRQLGFGGFVQASVGDVCARLALITHKL